MELAFAVADSYKDHLRESGIAVDPFGFETVERDEFGNITEDVARNNNWDNNSGNPPNPNNSDNGGTTVKNSKKKFDPNATYEKMENKNYSAYSRPKNLQFNGLMMTEVETVPEENTEVTNNENKKHKPKKKRKKRRKKPIVIYEEDDYSSSSDSFSESSESYDDWDNIYYKNISNQNYDHKYDHNYSPRYNNKYNNKYNKSKEFLEEHKIIIIILIIISILIIMEFYTTKTKNQNNNYNPEIQFYGGKGNVNQTFSKIRNSFKNVFKK